MADYKLSYFAIKGRGEPIRFLMKYGNIQFEDDRFDFVQWPKIKSTKQFGQVPVLTCKGQEYNQTLAICRYIAKQVNLTGEDDLENLEIDSIVDTMGDFSMKLAIWSREIDEEVKLANKDALFNETIPFYLKRFDKIVKDNGGYFATKKLTWADLFFVSNIDWIHWSAKTEIINEYKNLSALRDKVLAIPSIKKWVEERPKTDF